MEILEKHYEPFVPELRDRVRGIREQAWTGIDTVGGQNCCAGKHQKSVKHGDKSVTRDAKKTVS